MTKEEVGQILKNLRVNSGKTQKEVAEILGRKQQIIGHWETGYAQPDANTLFNLCEIYGASVDEAFSFNTEKVGVNKKEIEIIEAYRNQIHLQEAVDKVLGIHKVEDITIKLAARYGKKEMSLTPEQRKSIGKVVEEAKKDDNKDLF